MEIVRTPVRDSAVTMARNAVAIGAVIALATAEPWPVAALTVVAAAFLLSIPSTSDTTEPVSTRRLGLRGLSSRRRIVFTNFAMSLCLIGGVVLLVRRDQDTPAVVTALTAAAVALPAIAITYIVVRVLHGVMTQTSTEFEAFLTQRAAATAFGVLVAVGVAYTAADTLIGLPTLEPWWVLAFVLAEFGLVLTSQRQHLS